MSKIYVCDDDPVILMMVERVLGTEHNVYTCSNAEALMSMLAKSRPDLILLDYQMPDCDGLEGLTMLQDAGYCPGIPVIIVTGDKDTETEVNFFNEGVEDFISKPFVPDVLKKRVSHVLARSRERIAMQEKMEEVIKQSQIDTMTGLYNRGYAEERISTYLLDGRAGSFFMIDLDNFKYLNDTYGHVTGDEAICCIADILRTAIKGKGIAFRLGGDEFGLFLYDGINNSDLELFVTDLFGEYNRNAVEKDFLVTSSLSIGISVCPDDGNTYDDLYSAADKALYCAKRNGKNGYCFYSSTFTDTSDSRMEVVDIRQLEKLIQDKKELRDQGGVYKVDYREFQRIYNFISRCIERTHQKAKLVMVTLMSEMEGKPSINSIENIMKKVEEAVAKSLRRNDVGTRYSATQFLLVLIDIDDNNMNTVENRIDRNFRELVPSRNNYLLFEQMDIED